MTERTIGWIVFIVWTACVAAALGGSLILIWELDTIVAGQKIVATGGAVFAIGLPYSAASSLGVALWNEDIR